MFSLMIVFYFHNQGSFVARYKCHVCGQCFTRGNNLTVHLHKKHQFKWPSGHPRFRWVLQWSSCSNSYCNAWSLYSLLTGTRSTRMVSCVCSWFATRAWSWPSSWCEKDKTGKRRRTAAASRRKVRSCRKEQLLQRCRWNWKGCCWKSRGSTSQARQLALRKADRKRACCMSSLEDCHRQERSL